MRFDSGKMLVDDYTRRNSGNGCAVLSCEGIPDAGFAGVALVMSTMRALTEGTLPYSSMYATCKAFATVATVQRPLGQILVTAIPGETPGSLLGRVTRRGTLWTLRIHGIRHDTCMSELSDTLTGERLMGSYGRLSVREDAMLGTHDDRRNIYVILFLGGILAGLILGQVFSVL